MSPFDCLFKCEPIQKDSPPIKERVVVFGCCSERPNCDGAINMDELCCVLWKWFVFYCLAKGLTKECRTAAWSESEKVSDQIGCDGILYKNGLKNQDGLVGWMRCDGSWSQIWSVFYFQIVLLPAINSSVITF